MTTAVVLVAASAVVTTAIKAAGPLVLGAHPLPAPAQRIMALLAPALLTALVVTNTFATGRHLVVDARAAGVAAACVCIALRAPLLVTVIAAAAVTAGLRLVVG
ncbi:MAG: AzlD domain-containing protein [Candidatus Dormibacteria bacterium]